MSVVTVTLNPALDLTVRVDRFRPNAVNLGQDMRCRAGGKGVNVAACLGDHGVQVTATGLLGEANARRFEDLFHERGVHDAFVRVPGETRTNVKIVDDAAQETTDINLPGAAPPPQALDELRTRLAALVATHGVFVLAGSLPPGVPVGVYAHLTRELRAAGRAVAVDTRGEALTLALDAGPTFIKPNLAELQGALGRPLATDADVLAAARELVARGIELVVVSLGARGALFVTAREAVIARPPHVPVRTTVGAGDAMVAGVVAARLSGLDLTRAARLATAFSVAAITRPGARLPPRAELEALEARVQVMEVAAV